ncbi:ankyrin repeat-containing protein [Pyrus ussuriensis x Pyrus communis]|uniref:Ankyrin repeat-containing protein n=1 Tax=Pyrus ussuriensis x Pyrus communis TaxID=2448454 RepID=A0A5N5HTX7_9ROSA|nr:ankyrin repeat-containing protein [Pyrus ussuriensis x Pyrus communis]
MEITRHDEDEVYEASRTGSVESLNRLIEKDPDILWRISLQTGKTGTPLHVSALHGHAEFTKALCTNNPKLAERVDADRRTPLHLASAEGHKETVEALLCVYADACLRYDENGRIPLHYAAMRGEVEVLQKLIDKNPDSIYVKVENKSKETVLHLCIKHNQLECLKMLTGKTGTPLHVSALHGHAEFTKALCTNNPKLAERVNADRRTPLHLASAEGHKETVEALLCVYADACLRYDENGRIPLHYAAMRGEVEVLQKLIDKNPDYNYMVINVKVENKSKETVLHLCIKHNQLECLKMLVERDDSNGEFLNSRAGCDGGVTILHLALMLRQIKTIRYLLSVDTIRAEAVGVNGMSLTMSDILEYNSVAREDFSRSLEIQQILMDAGLIRRENNENDNPNSAVAAAAVVVSPNPRRVEKKKKLHKRVAPSEKGSKPARWFLTKLMKWLRYPDDWVKDTRGLLMVVATVISTMTFQAVVNPPGGVWDHNDTNTTLGNITICSEGEVCIAGTAVLGYMRCGSTSGLKNMITIVSFSRNDPTRFEEKDAPAVV